MICRDGWNVCGEIDGSGFDVSFVLGSRVWVLVKVRPRLVRRIITLTMGTIRISEADAARDLAGLMARVRAGAEVVIEDGSYAVAVIHTASPAATVNLRVYRAGRSPLDRAGI